MKLPLLLFLGLTFSPVLKAETFQASSVKTASGSTIQVGDSFHELVTRMGHSPSSMSLYTFTENQKQYRAMRYVYEIEGKQYFLTIVDNLIRQIEWISLDP